jgi:hypothetical protein
MSSPLFLGARGGPVSYHLHQNVTGYHKTNDPEPRAARHPETLALPQARQWESDMRETAAYPGAISVSSNASSEPHLAQTQPPSSVM